MTIIKAKDCGFCFGVKNAVELSYRTIRENPGKKIYTLGKLIHNESVTDKLKAAGVAEADSVTEVEEGAAVIIRSHGAGRDAFDALLKKGAAIVDATCPFVKKIHTIVAEYHQKGCQIVILGEADHPEVAGINGWCGGEAIIVGSESEAEALAVVSGRRSVANDKDISEIVCSTLQALHPQSTSLPLATDHRPPTTHLCVVAQTTFPVDKYARIVKIIQKQFAKSVEFFDTICYTTHERQSEAKKIAGYCDAVLVLGSDKSSNTAKLFGICKEHCGRCYLIQNVADLKSIHFKASGRVGIVAGASTPQELITEVVDLMAQQFNNEIQDSEFAKALEESPIKALKEGKRVKGVVIGADEKGISLNIGLKKDGFIPAVDAGLGEYNPADYMPGLRLEAVVVSVNTAESGCVTLSKKQVDAVKEDDKQVNSIRNGELFDVKIDKDTNGGVLGKLGTYAVFIPASQLKESFARDLKVFIGKSLRVTALEISDKKRRIVASARKVIEEERKSREDVFWANVQPDVIVNGKVKRITNFGAFVSVDGIDCLAHIMDLSWNHIKNAEDVVKVGKSYDFLVLSCDRERGRVSLSYKALQPHPFEACLLAHPVGSVCKGKVTSIVPFGAFVEIEQGIEGLVHVSEAAHTYVKSVGDVAKVGEVVDVTVLSVDPENKKINLSIKACQAAPVAFDADEPDAEPDSEEFQKAKPGKGKGDDGKSKAKKKARTDDPSGAEWSEEAQNNPLANLLKDVLVE
ncbi:MAG: 4-hydroxy-3-methylbut-2-enyl diphosphate reductase [Firmicutes bacterium]|nr:4-hydroxy-3-methylbut-2-enyl diphosphate reductase [Bacillota bacterium]